MYYKRHIDQQLINWKEQSGHKPLLLRGARQVGKSSAIRNLGKSFHYFVELNFERDNEFQALFDAGLNVKKICEQISALKQIPIIPGKTLLFLDEIQNCERAIMSLRYFYEDYPELHVVAAGSLLEFALRNLPSYGVGRITSLYMQPFSFDEFLNADGKSMLRDYKVQHGDAMHPLPVAIHNSLVSALRTYYLVGGMPESVSNWVQRHDYLQCSKIQKDIIATYRDDFGKYNTRIAPQLLRATLASVATQCGNKFIFSRVEGEYNTASVKSALELLELAGLIIPVTHTAANGIPLGAEVNMKFRKYILLDTGLMLSMLKMPAKDILLSEEADLVNKGGVTEMFAGLEIIKYSSPDEPAELFYWQRLDKGAQSEVDYIADLDHSIVPVEVKAGTRGSMQSLHVFMGLKHSQYGIRLCLENFGQVDNIKIIPLYAISNLLPSPYNTV